MAAVLGLNGTVLVQHRRGASLAPVLYLVPCGRVALILVYQRLAKAAQALWFAPPESR